MKKEDYKESAVLNWLQFTGGNKGYAIELIFNNDRHLEITIDKGVTANQAGNELIAAGIELLKLDKKDDWND